ncbi:MAG: helix-turn-helix domain-containing protein [Janthinobacterium lividum]
MIDTNSMRATLPGAKDIAAALASSRQLTSFISTETITQRVELINDAQQREVIELPMIALRLLNQILIELASGHSVKVVPIYAELTTQEGADMLNISRPHLIKLLESGALPYTKTGRHRRVKFADLMHYKEQREQISHDAMDALAAQAQELGLGY